MVRGEGKEWRVEGEATSTGRINGFIVLQCNRMIGDWMRMEIDRDRPLVLIGKVLTDERGFSYWRPKKVKRTAQDLTTIFWSFLPSFLVKARILKISWKLLQGHVVLHLPGEVGRQRCKNNVMRDLAHLFGRSTKFWKDNRDTADMKLFFYVYNLNFQW